MSLADSRITRFEAGGESSASCEAVPASQPAYNDNPGVAHLLCSAAAGGVPLRDLACGLVCVKQKQHLCLRPWPESQLPVML